jgi:hypothetical protein
MSMTAMGCNECVPSDVQMGSERRGTQLLADARVHRSRNSVLSEEFQQFALEGPNANGLFDDGS